ncbi:MAG: glycosyltransferase family 2 protein [Caldilineaceae bacterium]
MSLAALIITKDEAQNIQECIESICWVDEIVIVDAFSNDATVEIARQYTDKIYQHQWEGYSAQKNFGHSQCQSEWILSIDADERVTLDLRKEIQTIVQSADHAAYRIFIRDYMFGKWIEYGSWPKQCHIRLYQKNAAMWKAAVHEKIIIQGSVGVLSNPLLHYSHLTIAKFIMKMNMYTDIEAQQWYEQGIRKNWTIIVLSSIRKFWFEYIQQQGFRDKGHGLVLAVLMSTYHFLARVKLWELWYKHDHGIDT